MSGSIGQREYVSDFRTKYAIRVDKSNANLSTAFTGKLLCNVQTASLELPPKTLILRRLHCVAQFNLNLKRSFIVGNPDVILLSNFEIGQEYLIDSTLTPGSLGVTVWIITGYTGEKFTCPRYYNQLDSGLNDGTPVNN